MRATPTQTVKVIPTPPQPDSICGLNVCIPTPKGKCIMCMKPNTQYHGIQGWDLWEVTRPDSGPLQMEIALLQGGIRELTASWLCATWGHKMSICKPGSESYQTLGGPTPHLNLRLSNLQHYKKVTLFKAINLWYISSIQFTSIISPVWPFATP